MILDQRSVFAAALLGAALVVACGSSSSDKPGGASGGSAGAAGHATGSGGNDTLGGGGSGTSGSVGTAGGADAAGAAGADDGGTVIVATSKPHSAVALVTGGTIAHSKSFTGVFVLGEAPGGNGISTGKNGQLRGGVVGASQ